MDRRALLHLLFAFALLRPQAASADDNEGSGDESGSSDSGDESSSPEGTDAEAGDGSEDSGDGEVGDGGGDGAAGGSDSGTTDPSGGTGAAKDDHENALKAVQTEGVLSLELFLQRFHQQVEGKVIDVALSKRRGRFVFTVTSIDTDGKVRRRQFDAQSGKLIS